MYYDSLLSDTTLYPLPVGELFNWTADDDGDSWSSLPGLSSEQTLKQPVTDGDDGYNHLPTIGRHPSTGALVIMTQIHDYDEEGPGMFSEYMYSTDGGSTWSTPATLLESQDTMQRRVGNTGRVINPSLFATVGNNLYAVLDVTDRDFTSGQNIRTPVGIIAIQINGNGVSSGIPYWIHNGQGGSETVAPTPVSGFPSYAYNAELREGIFAYMFYTDPNNRPRVNNSARNYFVNQLDDDPTYGSVSECQCIKPEKSPSVHWYYKNNGDVGEAGDGYKIWRTDDDTTLNVSTIPDCTGNSAIVTRFIQVSDNVIISAGNDQQGNRTRLFTAFSSRNSGTGKYDITNSDVYVIKTNTDVTPDFEGDGKGGGPQSVDILLVGDILHITYSEKKEYIRYRNADISALT